jgi:hypothetical protein
MAAITAMMSRRGSLEWKTVSDISTCVLHREYNTTVRERYEVAGTIPAVLGRLVRGTKNDHLPGETR